MKFTLLELEGIHCRVCENAHFLRLRLWKCWYL